MRTRILTVSLLQSNQTRTAIGISHVICSCLCRTRRWTVILWLDPKQPWINLTGVSCFFHKHNQLLFIIYEIYVRSTRLASSIFLVLQGF
ncbi:hypothetical protein chiPu_0006525 [Chiloscyllium punctatum]|uniref:Uncharacterized protein n=1 Tax=Chiloscyllium punctatum TaxID=137246 RepID=A0A401SCG2_CHIPU|nr:hypothetical protein [Chiloscyllium punctatum]